MHLSQLRDELDWRENQEMATTATNMPLFWYRYLGDDEPVPLCRLCLLDKDPHARLEPVELDDPGWWLGLLDGFGHLDEPPINSFYRRVRFYETGGPTLCDNVLRGCCLSEGK